MLFFGGAVALMLTSLWSGQAAVTPPSAVQRAPNSTLPASQPMTLHGAETVIRSQPPTTGVIPAPTSSSTAISASLASLPPNAISGLTLPVVGVEPGDLVDTFTDARSQGRVHDAIDIMAARGTQVIAANDGKIVKLFSSVRGGLTVYQFDPQSRVIYYYAHLDSYAPGLAEGQVLRRGDPVGTVGSTGNASDEAPHLHFEIEILGPEKQWWHATSINPYGRFAGQH